MDIHAYYRVIWKRLWLVVLCCVVGVGVTLYYSLNQVPVYATTVTLALNPSFPSTLLPYQAAASVEALANSYGQFMRTRAFATLVAEAVGDQVTLEQISSSISTQYVAGTQFFKITAAAHSPEMAQQLANVTADVFIGENLARQKAREEQRTAQQASDRRSALEQQRASIQEMLENELMVYQGQMETLRQRIAGLEAEPASEVRNRDLQLQRQQLLEVQGLSMKAMTALIEAESKSTDTGGKSPIDTAAVVDDAALPSQPVSPNTARNVLYALLLSLVAGIGGVLLLEYVDYTFRTADELEQAYGIKTLGTLASVGREVKKDGTAREKLVLLHSKSPVAEAFRMLRTNVEFAGEGKSLRTLLVTSAAPGEGKTFTAVNLALAMAQAGKEVILVDSDLRKPALHTIFGLPNEFGLTNLIVDGSPAVNGRLQASDVQGLKVLTSGQVPGNPSEMLGSKRAEWMIQSLRQLADIVIFDSPPTSMVTDAVILATKVDAVLQVVRSGSTRRDHVLRGRDTLAKVGGTVLGPVLNMVRDSDTGYAWRYYRRYYAQHSKA